MAGLKAALVDLAVLAASSATRSRRGPSIAQIATAGAMGAAASLVAAVAFAALVAALWIYTRIHLGPVAAPLIVAGVLALLAIALALMAMVRLRPKQAPPRPLARSLGLAGKTGALPRFDLGETLRAHQGAAAAAALVLGLLAGRRRG